MAAFLSNQVQLWYKLIPDSINQEKMLSNYGFDYPNNRERFMVQQPYVFAQFLSLISRYEFQRIVNNSSFAPLKRCKLC